MIIRFSFYSNKINITHLRVYKFDYLIKIFASYQSQNVINFKLQVFIKRLIIVTKTLFLQVLCKLGQGQRREGRGLLVQGRDEGRHVQSRPCQVNKHDKRRYDDKRL